MANDYLTLEARKENALTLAAALGISVDSASQALEVDIVICADPTDAVAADIAQHVCDLLTRTVRRASVGETGEAAHAKLIIGAVSSQPNGQNLYLHVNETAASITSQPGPWRPCAPIPPLCRLLIACYAAAAMVYRATGSALPSTVPDPLILRFADLGVELDALSEPIELGHAYLAGAGAIGNGLLWAARYLDLRGRLEIVDDDHVTSGNLNRQIWFQTDDIAKPKAARLAKLTQPYFASLELVPRQCRLQDLPERSDKPWLSRLIVAVDSRRARRELQNEFPGEVFDASTTDIREVVIHHHKQPTAHACLSCIYEPDEAEFSREHHIAEHLGVTVEEVRSERISTASAAVIAARFPTLSTADIAGVAYDSLFKTLCSTGQLGMLTDKRILAPFAFVSVLAGALLAVELVRYLGGPSSAAETNYWRASPWHSPLARRRILRARQPHCGFCADRIKSIVNRQLWGPIH
jgi:hypothetical protein